MPAPPTSNGSSLHGSWVCENAKSKIEGSRPVVVSMPAETVLTDYIEAQLQMQGDDIRVTADDDLVELGLDSIAYVRLIGFIRHTYDVEIPPLDVTPDRFGTVNSISGYLKERGVA